MVDRTKLHPTWIPGVGFELRKGDERPTRTTLPELRTLIEVARFVHGDEEADRLESELEGLLEIKSRSESADRVRQTGEADAR
jgi:hypothetical protein